MRYVLACLILLIGSAARADDDPVPPDDLVLPKVDFSATDVQESGALLRRQTIHFSSGILRIDGDRGFSTTILDLTTQTQYLLMADRTYLVLPMDDALFRRFFPHSVAMSGAVKVGTDKIGGMQTTKYAFGDDGALDAAGAYWLTNTGIMVRREYDDGVFGQNTHHREYLTDITFGKQAADLFKIPAGYRLAR